MRITVVYFVNVTCTYSSILVKWVSFISGYTNISILVFCNVHYKNIRIFAFRLKNKRLMITTIQFKTLDDLYQFYNDAIFNGELSECIVNMSRHGGAFGFFAANRWRGTGRKKGRSRDQHQPRFYEPGRSGLAFYPGT